MKDTKPVILIVDDTPDNLSLASSISKDRYKVKVATSGAKALSIALADPPDLILLDVMMPEMDGYETCLWLKQQSALADIPVIFLTAKSAIEDEERGLALGAVDYITKPLSPPILLARINTHLTLKQAREFLKDKNVYLEAEIERRTKEIVLIQDVSILAMVSLAETRDHETGYHIQRTQYYVKELAIELKNHSRFKDVLSNSNIHLLVKSTPLHDIGKIGIPDHILLKPDKLTTEEFAIMKTHTTIGRDAIIRAEKLIEKSETFLKWAKELAYSHHEKWDGSGYPEGLSGEAIPVSGRLMAVADVYDALISDRVYKRAFSHAVAVDIIRKESGKHFDPAVVEAFLTLADHFKTIAEKFRDTQ